MEETLLKKLSQVAPLTPIDMGEFSRVDKSGLHFRLECWDALELGRLSRVTMSGMLGLMQMETLIFTPLTVDAPLYSFDYIHAMGQDTLLLELYDTQLGAFDGAPWEKVLESGQALPDNPLEPRWYDSLKLSPTLCKKGKKLQRPMETLAADWTQVYVEELKKAPACDQEAKRQRVQAYVKGLLEQGGPSVNQFKKLMGDEPARQLFSRYLFPASTAQASL